MDKLLTVAENSTHVANVVYETVEPLCDGCYILTMLPIDNTEAASIIGICWQRGWDLHPRPSG